MRVDLMPNTYDLIEKARRGEPSARNRLLEIHRDDVRRMIRGRLDRRVASRVDASDVVQEVLIEANRRLDDYLKDRPIPFHAWLRQIAGDRIVDAHRNHVAARKRSVTREDPAHTLPDGASREPDYVLPAEVTSPSHRLMKDEDRDQIRRAIDALPQRDREVLIMRHIQQLSTSEIAAALGIAEGAVKARLLRALVRLRGVMGAGA